MNAIEKFSSAVREVIAKEKRDRKSATAMVARRDPGLHEAYLAATNNTATQRELVHKSFEDVDRTFENSRRGRR